ncbi:4485_t:CDS:2 [Dentiscutata heterogama]|uniref:4485_t:CDS:1 n=1 Tax=Dentiscutata heterogama TaxID=1316150 RepID=A0ACA9KXQ5_9GLOM|nr:4485_t:CDS:2 [Dentiscutata heterogama]
MNRHIIIFLNFLIFLISSTFAACGNAGGCICDKNDKTGGLKCGYELNNHCPSDPSSIFQCSPNSGSICRYGSCSYGCCAVGNGKSYCCKDNKCSGCPSGKWIKKDSQPPSNPPPSNPPLSNPPPSNPPPSNPPPSNPSGYDRQKAVNYAGQYCLHPNSNYENYDKKGGDCTNFASQVLHAGGIPTDNIWKPGSTAWVNVQAFYNYLISHNLAKECQLTELKPGDFIQYYSSTWSHTVVVVKSGANPTVDSHSAFKCNSLHSYFRKGFNNDRGVCITK